MQKMKSRARAAGTSFCESMTIMINIIIEETMITKKE